MRKLASNFFILLFVVHPSVSFAQVPQQPESGFRLSLSEGRRDATMVSWQTKLVVRLTNTSTELIREDGCSAFGGLYKLLVMYNGVLLKEPEEARTHRQAMEAGKCTMGSTSARVLNPGEYWDDDIYYNTTKPGTYEFTVEKKAFPRDPEKTIIIKSNTITIVVPGSDAGTSK